MNNLKTLRKQTKKTQIEVAKYLNIDQTTYSGYETGKSNPSLETMEKMADFYSVSLDYLCGRPNANLIFTDSLSPNKKQLVNMIKGLSEDETLIALGWIARLANKPIDEVMKNVR